MHFFSILIYLFLCYVVRYRRKIVLINLRNAFPGLKHRDLKRLQRTFYRNFSAIFHEVLYYRKYNAEELLQRIHFKNPEAIRHFTEQGRSVMIVAGHCGNWELLGLTLPLATGCRTYGAAKKQSDPFFNKEINAIRTRMGLEIIQSDNVYRALLKSPERPLAAFFIADQTPPQHELDFWIPFMQQDTPVFLGPERIAKAMDLVVFFAAMERIRRGRYLVTFTLITDQPARSPEKSITSEHVRLLENQILSQPDNWLWSHRRWKHKKDRLQV